MEVLFLAMAILTGWQFVQLAGPADKTAPRWASALFEFALGAGGGIAIVSFLFFLELLFHVASSQVMLVSEAVLLLTAASLRLVRRSSATRASDRQGPVFWWYCVLGGALIISIAAVTAASVKLARLIFTEGGMPLRCGTCGRNIWRVPVIPGGMRFLRCLVLLTRIIPCSLLDLSGTCGSSRAEKHLRWRPF
jgi:hypothetical protein